MSVSTLVVDDGPDMALLFRQRFRREVREGTFVMHFANSGEDALRQLGSGIEPQLIVILSNVNMPGMGRLELLGKVEQRFSDMPVMMVTAYSLVVMPGHVGTDAITNSMKIFEGQRDGDRRICRAPKICSARFGRRQIRARAVELAKNFRDHAPLNATGAATIIVDGVKAERWRILVGKVGAYLDERVRAVPGSVGSGGCCSGP